MVFFKLINASATFQSYIHKILYEYLNIFVIIFLNNILIYFKNKNKHKQHVCTVLKAFLKTELYVKFSKYQFFVKRIFFVKFIIINERIKIKKDYIVTIFNWSKLKSIFEIQSFINFVNFYKRFIKNFFHIAVKLMNMLKSSKNVLKKANFTDTKISDLRDCKLFLQINSDLYNSIFSETF